MVKSTGPSTTDKPAKPEKPHKDFPLFPHATRRWAKKVRGKMWYFGPWDDPDGALERWLEQKDDLLAGRVPRQRVSTGVTLRDLVNKFLTAKKQLKENGELSVHTFNDYFATCERLIAALGPDRLLTDILPADFEKLRTTMAKSWGPVRLGNKINEVRIVFNYAYEADLVTAPVKFGEAFKRPSKKTLRKERAKKGPRMFTADELRKILRSTGQPMKAMFLLGINCGLGNEDVARLKTSNLDLKSGWLNYPRPKTGIMRRCPLWRETIQAIRQALKERPAPKADGLGDLVFLTETGDRWFRETSDNPVSRATKVVLNRLGITGNRNFYALRHTFETIGGGSRDQVAVDSLMGHSDPSMAGEYREAIEDERLIAVTDHIRKWLFKKG